MASTARSGQQAGGRRPARRPAGGRPAGEAAAAEAPVGPQSGIFHEGSHQHLYLEYDVAPDVQLPALRRALALALADDPDLPDERRIQRVIAFGPALWSRLAPDRVPPGLAAFAGVRGLDGHLAPATPHGLWFWLHGRHVDENLVAGLAVQRALAGLARLASEERGFLFRDGRDLTGFRDGTANPQGKERMAAALVPQGARGAQGSHVLVQRWVHDLPAFAALTEAEQSRVIGRDKATDEELGGRALPPDAHIRRADISRDGEPVVIYRRSVPFGGVREHGLYFVAFSRTTAHFDALLQSLFGATPDGRRDRLLDFSRPTSGAYYFAPSRQDLAAALAAPR